MAQPIPPVPYLPATTGIVPYPSLVPRKQSNVNHMRRSLNGDNFVQVGICQTCHKYMGQSDSARCDACTQSIIAGKRQLRMEEFMPAEAIRSNGGRVEKKTSGDMPNAKHERKLKRKAEEPLQGPVAKTPMIKQVETRSTKPDWNFTVEHEFTEYQFENELFTAFHDKVHKFLLPASAAVAQPPQSPRLSFIGIYVIVADPKIDDRSRAVMVMDKFIELFPFETTVGVGYVGQDSYTSERRCQCQSNGSSPIQQDPRQKGQMKLTSNTTLTRCGGFVRVRAEADYSHVLSNVIKGQKISIVVEHPPIVWQ
ncbi:hypothetical protein K474DRAFT_1660067 [Panus rudis PR-1116 ss-1]|nr:hypothetical protein K474DRAFT_1660067 [Panus rudis PR-1116 ss-1]